MEGRADAPTAIKPDFRIGIDSISTSGHKMIGTLMPCGALICRDAQVERAFPATAHLCSNGTTLMGFRNGHAVLAIWTRLMPHGVAGFAKNALRCTLRAADMASALRAAGVEVLLNPYSMTAVFPEAYEQIVHRISWLVTTDWRTPSSCLVLPRIWSTDSRPIDWRGFGQQVWQKMTL
jgi:histidine decarboxylase